MSRFRNVLVAASLILTTAAAQEARDGSGQREARRPWADDPSVQQVLAQRQIGIAAMTSGQMSAATERYSTTFVANAGRKIYRRFTDVFRRENGEWRHDLSHANGVRIED